MNQNGSTHENPSLKVVEIDLTQSQLKALQKLLPKGYTLELFTHKRDTTPRPTKKAQHNDPNTSKRNLNGDEDFTDKPTKGSREQRKKKPVNFEDKYSDLESIPATSSKSFKTNDQGVKKCFDLLQKLKKHKNAYPFLLPVDVEGLGLHDYLDIITEPMDLSTVEEKLKNDEYVSVNQFASDIRKIWNNAFRYNAKGSHIYQMTAEMSAYFERMFKEIENVSFTEHIRDLEKKIEELNQQINGINNRNPTSGAQANKARAPPNNVDNRPMSTQEKKTLTQKIRNLPSEHLSGVWRIVSESVANQSNNEEIEFEIDKLPPKVCRDLERYVKTVTQPKAPPQKKKPAGKANEISRMSMATSGYYDTNADEDMYGYQPQHVAHHHHHTNINTHHANDDADSKSSESSFLSE